MSPTDADPPAREYEPAVLRRWSDALAAAGMFRQALLTHPEDENLFRRGELAVLATEHAAALRALKEYDAAREQHEPPEPAAVLLVAVARTQAGEPGAWQEVQDAAGMLPGSAWTAWMVALAATIGSHLDVAGPAALTAVTGGCRDPRLRPVAAAGVVAAGGVLTWQQCAEAVQLVERSRRVQLAGEDAPGATLELLVRAGQAERATGLAAFASADKQVPRATQDAWREAARARQISVPRTLRLPGRAAVSRDERRGLVARHHDLTCRCAGSTGWIGPDRLYYAGHHLTEIDPDPVPGLGARLLTCRATSIRFLDLADQGLTLPVDAGEVRAGQ